MTGLLGNDEGTGFADKLSQGVGNLLGGGNAVGMDPATQRAAANNALLNLSIGILKGSAPSLDVSHRSFGNALAEGLAGAQGGYQNFLANSTNNAMNQLRLRQLKNNLALSQAFMGGGQDQGGAAGPVGQSAPQPVKSAAATAGFGFTMPGAPNEPTDANQPQSDTSAQAPAQIAQGTGNPMVDELVTRTGVPAQILGAMLSNDPQSFWKVVGQNMAPTEFEKTAAAAYGKGTAEYNQALKAKVTKENMTPLRAGAGYVGPDGQVHYTLPAPAPGHQYVPNPNGGYMQVPIEGAQAAMEANAAATARGSSRGAGSNEVVMVDMADGSKVPMTKNQYADALNSGTATGASPIPVQGGGRGAGVIDNSLGGGQQAPQSAPQQQAPTQSLITYKEPPKLAVPMGTQTPGAAAAASAAGSAAGKQYAADTAAAGSYQQTIQPIVGALHSLQDINTGPLASRIQNFQSSVTQIAPGLASSIGIDPKKVQDTDLYKKYTAQLGMGSMSAAGSPSDARLNQAVAGSPNLALNKGANYQVLQKMAAVTDMNQYIQGQFQNSGLPAEKWPAYKAQAQKQMDPAVFAIDYMTPEQKSQFRANMKPQQLQKFMRDYTTYKRSQ
ncbi:hypothetical protein [Burkholderia vietnamiensis]|uniref:hypothetical protein n=3 Tax=Burkholderiales TaxID=80840 RepID=UPI0012D91029|nr:hypothetical protein [Burkholderia vietnamiensis]